MTTLTAWNIIGAHALRSATGPEDELVALEALAEIAGELHLPQQKTVTDLAESIRSVDAQRRSLRDELDGQLKLNLGGGEAAP